MKRDKTLRFRVTEAEETKLKRLAKNAGFGCYSEYVRSMCFCDALKRERVEGLERWEHEEGAHNILPHAQGDFILRDEVLGILK